MAGKPQWKKNSERGQLLTWLEEDKILVIKKYPDWNWPTEFQIWWSQTRTWTSRRRWRKLGSLVKERGEVRFTATYYTPHIRPDEQPDWLKKAKEITENSYDFLA